MCCSVASELVSFPYNHVSNKKEVLASVESRGSFEFQFGDIKAQNLAYFVGLFVCEDVIFHDKFRMKYFSVGVTTVNVDVK